MSDWYDSYMRRLRAVSSAGARPGEQGTDIAQRVLRAGMGRTAPTPTVPQGNPRGWLNTGFNPTLGDIPKALGSPIKNFGSTLQVGGSFLDLISRGLYGTANVFTKASEQDKSVSFDPIKSSPLGETSGRTGVGEDLSNFWEGLMGREKNTFGDALRERGMKEGLGRSALGFGMDVVADPINLIPGAAFVKGASAIGKGGRAVGRHLPGFNNDPSGVRTIEELRRQQPYIPDTVRITPGDDAASNMPAPTGSPVSDMPAPTGAGAVGAATSGEAPGSRILAELFDSEANPRSAMPGQETLFDVDTFATQSLLETINKGIQNVPTSRNPVPFFRDDALIRTEPIMREVDEIQDVVTGGVDPDEFLSSELMSRYLREPQRMTPEGPRDRVLPIPKGYTGLTATTQKGATVATHRNIGQWVASASSKKERAARSAAYDQTIREAAGIQAKALRGKFKPGMAIKAKDQAGRTREIPFSRVIDYVKDGSPINPESARWVMPSYGMKPGSRDITYGEFIETLRNRVAQLPAKAMEQRKVGTKLTKVGEKEIYGRQRIQDFMDREIWKANMRTAGFTDEEIRRLVSVANFGEGRYDTALQKILATPFHRSYSLDEFIEGVRVGGIDDTVPEIQKMYRTIFGEKIPKTAKGRANALARKVEALERKIGKSPTLSDKAQGVEFDKNGQGLLDILVPGPSKASKLAKGKDTEIVQGVSDPESPWLEAKLDSTANPTAEEIVTEAATIHGDESVKAALNAPKVEINEVQARAVSEALEALGQRQFRDLDIWRHKTNRGAGRTSATPGEGYARWPSVNAMGQMTLERHLYKALEKNGAFQNIPYADRYDVVMPALKAAEQTLISQGISPTLGRGATGIPLSFHDILTTMGREWSVNNYFNVQQGLPHTHISEGVELILDSLGKGADAQTTWNALRTIAKKPLPGVIKKGPNGKPLKGKDGKTLRGEPRPNYFYNAHKGRNWNKKVDDEFVKPLIGNASEIHRIAESNRAALNLAAGQATKEISEEVIEKFVQDSTNGNIAGMLSRMANMRKEVTAATKAHPLGTIEGIARAASDEVTAELGPMGASLSSAARAATELGDARLVRNYKKMREITTKRGKDIDKELEGILAVQRLTSPPGAPTNGPVVRMEHTDLWDIGQDVGSWMEANVARRIAPHAGNKHIRPVLVNKRTFAMANASKFTRMLSDLTKTYPTADIDGAFHLIRSGGTSNAPVVADVKKMVNQIFDVDNPMFDAVHRNGMMLHEFNRHMEHFGMPKKFRFKDSFDEWRDWDIDDPLDFLSKTHATMQQVAAHQALGDGFIKAFGSTTKKPGYVKIVNESNIDSPLMNYLDTENHFFPREIAREFSVMDKALQQMTKGAGSGNATFDKVLRMYDTAFHSLKAGYTIYRIGHHSRNSLGDAWFNYMDGVIDPRYYTDAVRLLSVGRGRYPDFEFNRALQGVGDMPTNEKASKVIATVPYRGKKIKLSASKMYQLMYQKGSLPDSHTIEDLRFDTLIGGVESDIPQSGARSALDRAKKPFGGKVRQGAVAVSEVRDHYFRAAHFIRAMEDTKLPKGFKGTEEEAIDWIAEAASQRVRKFHPHGGDMTAFESAYMRRTVTFYSWARKAIPLVIELMMLKPGRFMHFPKAMYNIAEGMGVDLQGYGDPFPEDQLFPSFLRDSVQGVAFGNSATQYGGTGYWGLRTGHPGMDIIDDFLYSPQQTLEGLPQQLTPFARVPAELMAGSKFGTGAPIMDNAEYIGDNIPNLGYIDKTLDKLTGRSITSPIEGRYKAKSNEGYEPGIDNVGLINWLLGMGLTDMSKPSYIKTAEREIPEGRGR